MHYLLVVEVHYVQKLPELYFLPVHSHKPKPFLKMRSTIHKAFYVVQTFRGNSGSSLTAVTIGVSVIYFQAMERKLRVKEEGGTLEFIAEFM